MIAAVASVLAWGAGSALCAVPEIRASAEAVVGKEEPVRAVIRAVKEHVQAGEPVLVEFALYNDADEPVRLVFGREQEEGVDAAATQPEREATTQAAEEAAARMGLTPAHVFSGEPGSSIVIMRDSDSTLGRFPLRAPREAGEDVILSPGGVAGVVLDLTEYYDVLRRPGTYYIHWRPLGGRLASGTVRIEVIQRKQAIIETPYGNMRIEFYYDDAPNHVANFLELAQNRFYEQTYIHRVVKGILIQGGCPRGDGRGMRPDGKTLKAEFNSRPHELGTVSMARKESDPDSASCQFFITLGRFPEFDGRYTVFGHLVGEESYETLRRIAEVPTDSSDRPLQPIRIRAVRVVDAPASE